MISRRAYCTDLVDRVRKAEAENALLRKLLREAEVLLIETGKSQHQWWPRIDRLLPKINAALDGDDRDE